MSQVMRCPSCDRFLGKESIKVGKVEIKCPNCKTWLVIIAKPQNDTPSIHN